MTEVKIARRFNTHFPKIPFSPLLYEAAVYAGAYAAHRQRVVRCRMSSIGLRVLDVDYE